MEKDVLVFNALKNVEFSAALTALVFGAITASAPLETISNSSTKPFDEKQSGKYSGWFRRPHKGLNVMV